MPQRARQRRNSFGGRLENCIRRTCLQRVGGGCSPEGAARTHSGGGSPGHTALMAAAERRRQLQSHFREDDKPPQTPENRSTKTWRRALRHELDSPLEALALRGRNDGSEVMEDFFGLSLIHILTLPTKRIV